MPANAFIFDALVEPGDVVIVERPTYDRTLLSLRNRGADVRMVELEPDGIDVAALERVLVAGASPRLAHIISELPEPRGVHAVGTQARSAARASHVSTSSSCSRTIPTSRCDSPARRFETMVSMDSRERRVRIIVLEDRLPWNPGRLSRRTEGPDRQGHECRNRDLHIRQTSSRQGDGQRVLPLRRNSKGIDRAVKAALSEHSQALCAALGREIPDARFVEPEGGYFLWVELPRGTSVDTLFTAAAFTGASPIVKGSDFVLEGGDSSLRLAYSGVTVPEIEEGVARLADAYREVAPRQRP